MVTEAEVKRAASLIKIEHEIEAEKNPMSEEEDSQYPIRELCPMDYMMDSAYCRKQGMYSFKFKRFTYYYWISHWKLCVVLNTKEKEYVMWRNWDSFIAGILPEANKHHMEQDIKKNIVPVLFWSLWK